MDIKKRPDMDFWFDELDEFYEFDEDNVFQRIWWNIVDLTEIPRLYLSIFCLRLAAIVSHDYYYSSNINLVANYLSMSTDQLNESISTWLAKVRNTASTGNLNPEKKDSVVKILGALSAISSHLSLKSFSIVASLRLNR